MERALRPQATHCTRKYQPELRIRFSMKNLKRDGNLVNIPLYLANWMQNIV
ncbi:MAG: hypothetical protein IJP08_05435 [Bacteroidaceae bacterium]|nr:hypothetical protein [Bacteroidaceae bacterium]